METWSGEITKERMVERSKEAVKEWKSGRIGIKEIWERRKKGREINELKKNSCE